MKLRDYQQETVDNAILHLSAGKSTLAVLPTGCGKTIVFGHVVKRWGDLSTGRTLIIAHREELIFQARDKVGTVLEVDPEIEMGEFRATDRGLYGRAPAVVSTVQTLNSGRRCYCREKSDDTVGGQITGCEQCIGGLVRRMQRFDPNDFTLVITDEAHHGTAGSYRRVYDYFGQNPKCRFMGVTATPDRADEMALGQIFETVAYDYPLPQAIDDGWLVPIQQQYVECTDLDFSRVRTTAGDLNGADLERVMVEEKAIHSVITPTLEIAGDRTVLFFAASVAHAELMADVLNRHRPNSALCITGDTDSQLRRAALKAFSQGHYRYLCGCGVFLEGFDEPRLDVIAMARPTKSRTLYAQAVGRGTRPIKPPRGETPTDRREEIARSSKPSVLVLDFVGNSGRHKLISTADILGGIYEDDVVELAVANAKQAGGQRNMQDELQAAQVQIQLKQADARRAQIKADSARFSRQNVDPFDVYDIAPARTPGYMKGKSPADRQVAALVRFGIDEAVAAKMDIGKAGQLLSELIRRKQQGLCSYKQAKILRKHGQTADVTFEQASKLIDRIKANGWRPLPTG